MGQIASRARAVAKVSPPAATTAAVKPPATPSASKPPAPEAAASAEMAQHASIERLLRQTEINSQTAAPTTAAAAAAAASQVSSARIDEDQLQALLTLHSQEPAKWTSASLAERFALEEACVANVVAHCIPFRVWQNDNGKMHAVPMSDPDPAGGPGREI